MSELQTTQDIVLEILKSNPKARNSDNHLFYSVYAVIGKRNGIDIERMAVPTFFLHLKEFGFPSTETIRRTRQKIQAAYPTLCGTDEVEAMRIVREEEFKDYSRKAVDWK